MKNEPALILLVIVITIIQSVVASFFPLPLSLVNLSFVIISAVALSLHPRSAILMAAASGIATDLFAIGMFGINLVSLITAVILAVILINRIFTHYTISALIGVNIVIFLLFHFNVYLLHAVLREATGKNFFHSATWFALLVVLAALPLQIGVAVSLRLSLNHLYSYTSKFILLR